MDDTEKSRPDVVIYRPTENKLFDVRNVVGGDPGYYRQAGQLPGFGAQWGAHEKYRKLLGRCTRQVAQFIHLVHGAGETNGAPALDSRNTLAVTAAGSKTSKRDVFMAFALQRLRLATSRGVTAVLLKSPILRNGP